jgi:hypothetical protein
MCRLHWLVCDLVTRAARITACPRPSIHNTPSTIPTQYLQSAGDDRSPIDAVLLKSRSVGTRATDATSRAAHRGRIGPCRPWTRATSATCRRLFSPAIQRNRHTPVKPPSACPRRSSRCNYFSQMESSLKQSMKIQNCEQCIRQHLRLGEEI